MRRVLFHKFSLLLFTGALLLGVSWWLGQSYLSTLLVSIENKESWEALLLGVLYIPAALLFVPAVFISLTAGFLLGVIPGGLTIWIGTTVGGAAAFLLSRTVARSWVEERVIDHPKFLAIDKAVERQAFVVVLVSRLVPFLSWNFLNYAFGLTRISFRKYIIATAVGMFPAAFVLAYFGSSANSLMDLLSGFSMTDSPVEPYVMVIGLAVLAVLVMFVFRSLRQAFSSALMDADY